ncbi:hypothetical protein [Yoonia sp.]|uniref:hypothetical protein n=1 Tax=Yoonia sp. TaxID=2212373 RepID=UPI00358E94A0
MFIFVSFYPADRTQFIAAATQHRIIGKPSYLQPTAAPELVSQLAALTGDLFAIRGPVHVIRRRIIEWAVLQGCVA